MLTQFAKEFIDNFVINKLGGPKDFKEIFNEYRTMYWNLWNIC